MPEVPCAAEVSEVGDARGVLEEPLGPLALAEGLSVMICAVGFGLDLGALAGALSSSLGVSFHYFGSFLSGAYAAQRRR